VRIPDDVQARRTNVGTIAVMREGVLIGERHGDMPLRRAIIEVLSQERRERYAREKRTERKAR